MVARVGIAFLRGERPVGHGLVAERVEGDELAVAVIGQDVGVLDGLAFEFDGGEHDDLVALGDGVVRVCAEALAHA